MRNILVYVALLLALTVNTQANAQVITFKENTKTITVALKDYSYGISIGGTSVRLVNSEQSTTTNIALTPAAFVAASNGEFILVTSAKKQGAFNAGDVIVMNRQNIKYVSSNSASQAVLNLKNASSSLTVSELYTAVSSALATVPSGGGGTTNLSYTASPTNGIVNNSSGTSATLPLATGTNAGLQTPANFTKISAVTTIQEGIQPQDEGTNLGTSATFNAINFTGAGVTATRTSNTITVNVPASSGSAITQYSAGNNVLVTADGAGITATKTSGAWVVTVPSGVHLINCSVNVLNTDIQTAADGAGSTNWVTIQFTGAGIHSNSTFGTYHLPIFETQVLPVGAVSITNTVAVNTTGQSFSALGANTFTTRKINMSSTNDHVISFSNF